MENAPAEQEAQKTDNKKSEIVPKLDISKSALGKGKTTLNERSAGTDKSAKAEKIRALFTPEPSLNFYLNQGTDIESDAMVVDTEDEREEAAKGKKRKAPPLRNDVSDED